mgnify:CR=1 FL=1
MDNRARFEHPDLVIAKAGYLVEGLFEKVPARRKFLRSPRAEYAACLDVVKRLAMARSDVAFSLEHDGRQAMSLQPSDPPARVAALLSAELDRFGVGVECVRDGIRLSGVVSLPTLNRGLADQQFLLPLRPAPRSAPPRDEPGRTVGLRQTVEAAIFDKVVPPHLVVNGDTLTGIDFRGFDCVELSPPYDPSGIRDSRPFIHSV